MPRVYCVVYGCLNSAVSHPNLSFFKLPIDRDRRAKWLHLIAREDLMDKPPQNYTVCEIHFNPGDVLIGTQRKKLKFKSIPALNLPVVPKIDEHLTTGVPRFVDISTQTDINITFIASVGTQTRPSILDTSQKRKKTSDLAADQIIIKLNEIDNKTEIEQRDIFFKLCDKFLTKELAEKVKAQTNLNKQ